MQLVQMIAQLTCSQHPAYSNEMTLTPLDSRTINRLKGKATILFITHHVPRGLQVDEVYHLRGREGAMRMELVEEGVMGGKE